MSTRWLIRFSIGLWLLIGLLIIPASSAATAPVLGPPPLKPVYDPATDSAASATTSTSDRPQGDNFIYLPLVSAARGLSVNPQSRQASLDFYRTYYLMTSPPAINWTGSHAACTPGTTDPAFRAAVNQRLNYFRGMAGVPAIVTFSDESNGYAQAAALMMSANGQLSHSPPTNWLCYSSAGATGAGSSDLYLGVYGWNAITGYMLDPGAGNYVAGHRRWILYPQTQTMGTGDVPPVGGHWSSNALRVFDSHMWEARPATREEYVAWPPPGYVPYPVVFARWSFAYANADFSSATVSMSTGGQPVPVVVSPVVNGYGENTLVWIPNGLSDGATWPKPVADTIYTVQIQHVIINTQPHDFTYTVTIFDPDS